MSSNARNFSLETDRMNLAEITLQERYPASGYALNTASEIVVYVLNGRVSLNQNGISEIVEKNSAVLVKMRSKYYWEPQGEVTLLIFSSPAWTAEQQIIV